MIKPNGLGPRTPDVRAQARARQESMPFESAVSPKKAKPLVLSIREVMQKKRRGTSAQGKSDVTASNIIKTEKNQFSFGERSSNDDKGSVNLNKIDDALQDLNDRDRRVNLRHTIGSPSPGEQIGRLAVKKQNTDLDIDKNADINDEKSTDPLEQRQSQHEADAEVHSKNLSEYTNLRVSMGMEKKLRGMFRGFQNAQDLIESQIDPSKQGFSINESKGARQVDVVFFFHGTVSRERQFDLEPQL